MPVAQTQPADVAQRLQSGQAPRLLDVREPNEFELCALPGAQLIPLGELPARLQELDPKAEYVVYCHHGGRSMRAAMFLEQQGFSQVANLEGGIDAWAAEVDPTLPRY